MTEDNRQNAASVVAVLVVLFAAATLGGLVTNDWSLLASVSIAVGSVFGLIFCVVLAYKAIYWGLGKVTREPQ